jgi:hypothetical protein
MDKGRILDSWKEIAAYLDRSVRACQKWERELGLPVHRLGGAPRGHVFAYKDELDHWLSKKLHQADRARRVAAITLRILVAAVVILFILVLVLVFLWKTAAGMDLEIVSEEAGKTEIREDRTELSVRGEKAGPGTETSELMRLQCAFVRNRY